MNLRVLDVRLRDFHSPAIYLESDALEDVQACPACTAHVDQRWIAAAEGRTEQSLRLTQCAACSHVYLSRRPNREWFQRYYSLHWDTGRVRENSTRPLTGIKAFGRRSRLARRAVRAMRVFKQDLPEVMYPWPARFLHMVAGIGKVVGDEFPRGKKLLEIGAGYGGALSFLRDAGLDTYGTEANAHRVVTCQAQGLKVLQTSIDDFGPITRYAPFDFVFSSHVFEHLTDLSQIMRGLEPLVASGGFIYVEVPHGPVAEDIVLRTHIPVHCHVFSASSLSALMKRFGFQPVRILADVGLHVVAQKGHSSLTLGEIEIPSTPDSMVHGLDVVAEEEGPLRVCYDNFCVDIFRVADGARLYSRPFPYGVMALGESDRNEFIVEVEPRSEHGFWPLRFLHMTDQAPIWVKHQ